MSRSRSRERKKKKKKHKYKQKKSKKSKKKSKKRARDRSTSESEKSDKETNDFEKDMPDDKENLESATAESKVVPSKEEQDAESSDLDIKAMLDGIEEEMDLGELMKQKEFLQKKLGLDGVSEDELFGEKEKENGTQKQESKPQELIEVHSDAEPEVVEIKSDSDVEI